MSGISSNSIGGTRDLYRPTASTDTDAVAPQSADDSDDSSAASGDSLGLSTGGASSDSALSDMSLSVSTPPAALNDPFMASLTGDANTTPAKSKGWTVAVDLATTLRSEDGKVSGAEAKAQQLKDLAAKTEGKPVTIIAQLVTQSPDGPQVERFKIANGKVNEMGTRPSEGFAEDLQSLVSAASNNDPSGRLGLIIQSHGNGVDGMEGDNGKASVNDIREAISKGLSAGGASKLDMLDFDACLMGQNEVLSSMQGLADHVVASSEVEIASPDSDGQRTDRMLDKLLANPEMSGADLAKTAVEVAGHGTPTLAAYDTKGVQGMEGAIDGFGQALNAAAQDPKGRAAIEKVIQSVPHYGDITGGDSESSATGAQQRDLKTFAKGIDAAIASGAIADPDGKLAKASASVQQAIDSTVEAHHDEKTDYNDTAKDYTGIGNVGVFLPSDNFYKGDNSPLHDGLAMVTDSGRHLGPKDDVIQFGQWASQTAATVGKSVPPELKAQYAQFQKAADAVANAPTQAAARAATKHLVALGEKLKDGTFGQQLAQAQHQAFTTGQLSKGEAESANAGWNAFLDTMKSTAK